MTPLLLPITSVAQAVAASILFSNVASLQTSSHTLTIGQTARLWIRALTIVGIVLSGMWKAWAYTHIFEQKILGLAEIVGAYLSHLTLFLNVYILLQCETDGEAMVANTESNTPLVNLLFMVINILAVVGVSGVEPITPAAKICTNLQMVDAYILLGLLGVIFFRSFSSKV